MKINSGVTRWWEKDIHFKSYRGLNTAIDSTEFPSENSFLASLRYLKASV
jgi:hypothetical protein